MYRLKKNLYQIFSLNNSALDYMVPYAIDFKLL